MRGKYRRRSLAKRIRAAAELGNASVIAAAWEEAQQLRLSLPADVQKIVNKPTTKRGKRK
jgi:hypothetical protein